LHANVGKTSTWGQPKNKAVNGYEVYSRIPFLSASSSFNEPLLVAIDGRYRVVTLLATLLFAPIGTETIFDDYFSRPEYHDVSDYISPTSRHGCAALFVVTKSYSYDEFSDIIERFKYNSN